MYFPIFAGNLPVLRITRYNPNGLVSLLLDII